MPLFGTNDLYRDHAGKTWVRILEDHRKIHAGHEKNVIFMAGMKNRRFFMPGMKKSYFHAGHGKRWFSCPVSKKAVFMPGMKEKEVFTPSTKTSFFHAGDEKKEVSTLGMKKRRFSCQYFNGRLCLSQLKRRSGLLKAGGNLDRY